MHEITTKSAFAFIYKMARPFPIALTVMLMTAVIWSIDLSLRPYLLKIMLNRLTDSNPQNIFDILWVPALAYFGSTFFISTFFRFYGYFVEIRMVPEMRKNIAQTIFKHLIEHSHHYYSNNFSGTLTNKVNDLTRAIPDIVRVLTDKFLSHALALGIAIYALWQVNIEFALAMIVWTSFFAIVAFFTSPHIVHLSDKWSEMGSAITGKIVDVLSNILSVRLFSRAEKENHALSQTFQESVNAEKKLEWLYFWIWLSYGFSFTLMQGVSLYFLIRGYAQGSVSIGDFALVLTINGSIANFFWELMRDFSQFSQDLGKIIQALRITTAPHDIVDASNSKELIVSKGKIVFDHVQFRYKNTEPLFKNKSVTIHPGEKVGLVGYSGSGKSTFVNLILRLYDVTSGKIMIDDQDICTVTQDSLHRAISMIPQDPSLFHRTLHDNIRYGRLDATDQDLFDAAKKAHAHEFINKLSDGYNSLVGERGIKLSGGQRQRIAISRAILKNAPILILDEATSQLDSVTEGYIQESLWNLMQGKTTLVVAHRLSTLLHMDRILVFDHGKIIEDGTHKDLLALNGLYKNLWDAQVGGFLPDEKNL